MKEVQLKKAGSLALCLGILGVAVPASGDTKSVHGAICQTDTLFNGGSVVRSAIDGVYVSGPSGAGAYVVCPLIRDRINSSTSMSAVVIEVYIPSGGGILCGLYSQSEDGSAGSYVDVDSEERYTTGQGQMSFSVTSSSGNEGTYGLFCDMSNGTKIHHIHTDESGTD
jgi:hypothetical protein